LTDGHSLRAFAVAITDHSKSSRCWAYLAGSTYGAADSCFRYHIHGATVLAATTCLVDCTADSVDGMDMHPPSVGG